MTHTLFEHLLFVSALKFEEQPQQPSEQAELWAQRLFNLYKAWLKARGYAYHASGYAHGAWSLFVDDAALPNLRYEQGIHHFMPVENLTAEAPGYCIGVSVQKLVGELVDYNLADIIRQYRLYDNRVIDVGLRKAFDVKEPPMAVDDLIRIHNAAAEVKPEIRAQS